MNTSQFSNLTRTDLERLACLQSSQHSIATISIKADDGRAYLLATVHYLDGIHEANSIKDARGTPERLTLRFTTAEVVVLASRLERIEDKLAEGRLRGLKTIEPRLAAAIESGPVIFSIIVNRKNEV